MRGSGSELRLGKRKFNDLIIFEVPFMVPQVFYVYGAIGCVWYVFWAWLVRESPEKESRMSDEERRYIMVSLKHTANTKPQTVPWKELFSSAAVWAIVASHFSENWGVYTLLTQLPLYMKREKTNRFYVCAIVEWRLFCR